MEPPMESVMSLCRKYRTGSMKITSPRMDIRTSNTCCAGDTIGREFVGRARFAEGREVTCTRNSGPTNYIWPHKCLS